MSNEFNKEEFINDVFAVFKKHNAMFEAYVDYVEYVFVTNYSEEHLERLRLELMDTEVEDFSESYPTNTSKGIFD